MSFPGSGSLCSNKATFCWFYSKWNKKEKKGRVQGTNWMGYCPFPTLGRDTAGGVTTRAVGLVHGRQACMHGWATARAMTRAQRACDRRSSAPG